MSFLIALALLSTPAHAQPGDPMSSSFVPVRDPVAGSCSCPFDVDSRGYRCGARSAYNRPGGEQPQCYVPAP